jgi:hypothetical protein
MRKIKRKNDIDILKECLKGKWILYFRMAKPMSWEHIKQRYQYLRAKNICEEIKNRIRNEKY